MKILGINDGHHSSASLIINGKVVAAVSEERFSRRKGEHGYPSKAIKAVLKIGDLDATEIDHIAIATKGLPPIYFKIRRDSDFGVQEYWREQLEFWYPTLYENKKIDYMSVFDRVIKQHHFEYDDNLIKNDFDLEGMKIARAKLVSEKLGVSTDIIDFYDHHACHAYYGLTCVSDTNEPSLIFTADGFGDGANASIWIFNGSGCLEKLLQTDKCHIGRMYRYATLLLGMKPAEHEFKVMGLAPYANPMYGQKA